METVGRGLKGFQTKHVALAAGLKLEGFGGSNAFELEVVASEKFINS